MQRNRQGKLDSRFFSAAFTRLIWMIQSFVNIQRIPSNDNDSRQVLSFDVEQREVVSGSRGRIAAVTIDQCVTVWSLSASDVVTKIFSFKVQDFVPKAVRFHKESRDLFLFARSGGGMYVVQP